MLYFINTVTQVTTKLDIIDFDLFAVYFENHGIVLTELDSPFNLFEREELYQVSMVEGEPTVQEIYLPHVHPNAYSFFGDEVYFSQIYLDHENNRIYLRSHKEGKEWLNKDLGEINIPLPILKNPSVISFCEINADGETSTKDVNFVDDIVLPKRDDVVIWDMKRRESFISFDVDNGNVSLFKNRFDVATSTVSQEKVWEYSKENFDMIGYVIAHVHNETMVVVYTDYEDSGGVLDVTIATKGGVLTSKIEIN